MADAASHVDEHGALRILALDLFRDRVHGQPRDLGAAPPGLVVVEQLQIVRVSHEPSEGVVRGVPRMLPDRVFPINGVLVACLLEEGWNRLVYRRHGGKAEYEISIPHTRQDTRDSLQEY